jgi:hypothetical protein
VKEKYRCFSIWFNISSSLITKYKRIIAHRFAMCHLFVTRGLLTCFGCGKGRAARQCATSHLRVGLPRGALGLRPSAGRGNSVGLSSGMTHNDSGIGGVVALMNFLSQSALQALDVGGWRGLFCSLSVETKFCNLKIIYTFVSLSDMKKLKTLHPFTLPLVVISTVGQPL